MPQVAVDPQGVQYVHPHGPRCWDVEKEYTTQQTDAVLKEAPGGGLSLYITDLTVICNAAVTVTIEQGTTVLKFKYYAAGQGDGAARSYISPKKLQANQPITVTTSAAVTVYVEVHGYTAG